jgi:hypothetical protein
MRETAARQSPPSKGAASSIGPAKTSKRSSAQDRISRMVALSARDIGVQRACGCNGGAGRKDELMGRSTTIQPSLTVSTPGDPFELEADRVADQVMRMPASTAESRQISRLQISRFADNRSLHRSCTTCAAADGDPSVATAEGLSGGGEMLDDGTRTFMEERFGHDFSDVRVHTESQAADSARSLDARAYTVGSDIVFANGQYAPGTNQGRRLIAHELTHVSQQSRGSDVNRQMVWRDCSNTHGACAFSDCAKPDVPGTGESSWWHLSVFVDVEADSPEDVDLKKGNIGHTSVVFQESNSASFTFGFYPARKDFSLVKTTAPGMVVHPDHDHDPCVDYKESFNDLTKAEYDKALHFATAFCGASPTYDLQTNNCTTFAKLVVEQAGRSLPNVRGKVGSGMISGVADNPNTLLEGLKDRDVPTRHLTSDTDIRTWILFHGVPPKPAPDPVQLLPAGEKLRLINRLLDGWIAEGDIAAVERICGSVNNQFEMDLIKKQITPRESSLHNDAQRARLHSALSRII